MSRDNISTPGRGETWYEGDTPDTTDNSFETVIGATKVFEDINWGDAGIKSYRTGARQVVCRLVRNKSGATLYGKRLVQIDPTNPNHILGYSITLAQEAYPLDEFLPATGLQDGDLGWIVIKGPAVVKTPFTGAEFQTASIAAGANIIAGTHNAASTAAGTTGVPGRASGFTIVAATTAGQFSDLINAIVNRIGRAMSAITSGQTDSDMLVDVRRDNAGWP